jgi:hypothetical protein
MGRGPESRSVRGRPFSAVPAEAGTTNGRRCGRSPDRATPADRRSPQWGGDLRPSARAASGDPRTTGDPPGTQARLSFGIAIFSSDGPVRDVRFPWHLPEPFRSCSSRDLRFRALHVPKRSCLQNLAASPTSLSELGTDARSIHIVS